MKNEQRDRKTGVCTSKMMSKSLYLDLLAVLERGRRDLGGVVVRVVALTLVDNLRRKTRGRRNVIATSTPRAGAMRVGGWVVGGVGGRARDRQALTHLLTPTRTDHHAPLRRASARPGLPPRARRYQPAWFGLQRTVRMYAVLLCRWSSTKRTFVAISSGLRRGRKGLRTF